MNCIRLELIGPMGCGKTFLAGQLRRLGVAVRDGYKEAKGCHGEIYACASGVTTVVRHLKDLGHTPIVSGRVVRVDMPARPH